VTERSALGALLAVIIVRFWLMPLPSSFWTDETGTVFILHYGNSNGWPGLPPSIYYALPRAAEAVGGFSEIVYRLPSLLAMGAALFLIARLAARLIHPGAAWFAAFACLALRGFNFQAADARPYGLGMCVMVAALWFLVRWLDGARWRDAVLFVIFAVLLWWVQPVYGPFYLVFAAYTLGRLISHETPVTWMQACGIFAVVVLALAPALGAVLALSGNPRTHVISPPPGPRELIYSLQLGLVLGCFAGAWLVSRLCGLPGDVPAPARSSLLLIGLWWLSAPCCLFAFSRWSGFSVFVPRYYSLALPGAALAAASLAARHIPAATWKRGAAVLGLVVLALNGNWRHFWPVHANVDWRGAARAINQVTLGSDMPIICPSPFVEAQTPLWRPGYSLPSILYAPLATYPVTGQIYPFPFQSSPEAEQFAAALATSTLQRAPRFFVYGHRVNAYFWEDWFQRRPELAGWTSRRLGPFGDVAVVEFDRAVNR